MRLVKIAFANFVSSFLKMFAMCVYSVWAVKLGIIETEMDLLFAVPMVLLSIYGLWIAVRKASDLIIRTMDAEDGLDTVQSR